MKEFDALMKALEDEGIVKALQITVSVVPAPKDKTEEEVAEMRNDAIKNCLMETFATNEKLENLFGEYAVESALRNIIKKLDIKPDREKAKDMFIDLLISKLF